MPPRRTLGTHCHLPCPCGRNRRKPNLPNQGQRWHLHNGKLVPGTVQNPSQKKMTAPSTAAAIFSSMSTGDYSLKLPADIACPRMTWQDAAASVKARLPRFFSICQSLPFMLLADGLGHYAYDPKPLRYHPAGSVCSSGLFPCGDRGNPWACPG